jgi:hypothetical protein
MTVYEQRFPDWKQVKCSRLRMEVGTGLVTGRGNELPSTITVRGIDILTILTILAGWPLVQPTTWLIP